MDPRIRASWYVNYLYLCQQQAPVYMSDQINSNKFHTINSTMSFQHEEKWKFIKQVTGYPATQTTVDKQQLIPIYRLFIHYIQDDVSESKSVTVPARQLIWADFDDLQVLWAVLAVPAWAALLLTCFWTWFLKHSGPSPGVFNASVLVQSQYTVLQVSVQTNKSRYELDWNWMGENEIKMREWERWEIDEIHFRAQSDAGTAPCLQMDSSKRGQGSIYFPFSSLRNEFFPLQPKIFTNQEECSLNQETPGIRYRIYYQGQLARQN